MAKSASFLPLGRMEKEENMSEQDKEAFESHIANVSKGRGMMINRLDLHELTWHAALKYERDNNSPNEAYIKMLQETIELERERSKRLVEALEYIADLHFEDNAIFWAEKALKEYRGEHDKTSYRAEKI